MFTKTLSRGLIVAAAFFAMNTMADTLPAVKIAEMMKMPMIDTDKDGMVSKAEYLAMAGKVFDMKVKEMNAKDGKLQSSHFYDLLRNMMGQ